METASDSLSEIFGRSDRTPLEPFTIGAHEFEHHPETSIMGVINLSPDSFYRETVALSPDAVQRKAEIMASEGAAIADLGIKSSRSADATVEETMRQKLGESVNRLAGTGLVISIDADDPGFAEIALDHGAEILNVTTTSGDEAGFDAFLALQEKYRTAMIACYTPEFSQFDDEDAPGFDPVLPALEKIANQLRRHGIDRAWIDPGLGFSARLFSDHDQRIKAQLNSLFETQQLRSMGFPVCQSMPNAFEHFQEHVTSAEVLFGTVAALGGSDLIRTHEPGKMAAVLKTLGTLAPGAGA